MTWSVVVVGRIRSVLNTLFSSLFQCLANLSNRILDNAHLLDATEIFRTLNKHKKVNI